MTSDLERNKEKIREWRSEKCDSSILQFFSSVPKCKSSWSVQPNECIKTFKVEVAKVNGYAICSILW